MCRLKLSDIQVFVCSLTDGVEIKEIARLIHQHCYGVMYTEHNQLGFWDNGYISRSENIFYLVGWFE